MEFQDVIRRRRMVRNYTDEPVPQETIERIMRLARRAPSGGYSQGQSFVVVTDADQRARIAEAMDEALYVEKGGVPWISRAPVHVVVTASESFYHERYQKPDKLEVTGGVEITWPVPYWFVDAGASMMALLLAAVDAGLGAGFAGHPDQHERLRAILGLPEHAVPIGVVTIGHEAEDPNRPASSVFKLSRRDDADVIHWQRWGSS